jgi:hypothetical protein
MPVFLERFVLPILVALVVGVCLFNPWKWDWHQRGSLFVGVVFLAYFFAYTSYHGKAQVPSGQASTAATTSAAPSVNTTTGPQSPIMPNNSGNVKISNDDSKPKEPPPKDKPK